MEYKVQLHVPYMKIGNLYYLFEDLHNSSDHNNPFFKRGSRNQRDIHKSKLHGLFPCLV